MSQKVQKVKVKVQKDNKKTKLKRQRQQKDKIKKTKSKRQSHDTFPNARARDSGCRACVMRSPVTRLLR